MAVLNKSEIAALSDSERLALIDALWESLEAPRGTLPENHFPVLDWQETVLDERLLDLALSPGDEMDLVEARSQSLL
jgi:hypothetical protein